jgi:hypothetical protein
MSRPPHFLDNQRTDGGEVVSPTRRPPFTPRNIPGTHFCQRLSRPQGHSVAERIRSIKKSNDLIGIQTSDLPACSIVPQPTTLKYFDIYLFIYLLFVIIYYDSLLHSGDFWWLQLSNTLIFYYSLVYNVPLWIETKWKESSSYWGTPLL